MFPEDEVLALIKYDDPVVVGYCNLFDPGDVWIKRKGCEKCPSRSRRICCGKCPYNLEHGCHWHDMKEKRHKPNVCVIDPNPRWAKSFVNKCMNVSKGQRRVSLGTLLINEII